MFIITDVNDVIIYKSRTGAPVSNGFLVDSGTYTIANPGCKMHEVDAIPDGHGIVISCYTEENGFFANPDYVEPKTSIDELIAENKMLKAQVQAQTERSDFLEDCLAEMAMQVYNT